MTEQPADKQQGTARKLPGRPFQPGESGNPNGRPRGYDLRKLMEQALGKTLGERLVNVGTKLLDLAEDGDVPAAKLVLEKLCDNRESAEAGDSFNDILRRALGVPPRTEE